MGTNTKSFTSAMTGAPVLSGTAGALIAVLDATLVNGFGIAAPSSVVVTGGIATATYGAGHSFEVGSVALFAGATPAGLNGEKRILTKSATAVTFDATGISNQTATGSISSKVAPAGWTKLYSGTNLAAYKMGGVAGTGGILRVDDTGTTNARVVGYMTMSDINTGTKPFPASTQVSGGMYWGKSSTASAVARNWAIFSDDCGVYVGMAAGASFPSNYAAYYFGDLLANRSPDPMACELTGNPVDLTASSSAVEGCVGYSSSVTVAGYVPQNSYSIGSAKPSFRFSLGTLAAYSGASTTYGTFPNLADNGLLIEKVQAFDSAGFRGTFPGVYHCTQAVQSSFLPLDTQAGSGAFAGKILTALTPGPTSSAATGVVFFDAASDWR